LEIHGSPAWLRKLIRRKVLDKPQSEKYLVIIEQLGPKLNAFINTTKVNNI